MDDDDQDDEDDNDNVDDDLSISRSDVEIVQGQTGNNSDNDF
jgi:NACalpha-BTF3-like transcription factor